MEELLKNKLQIQTRELLSSGIVRLAMSCADVTGDILPRILYSNYENKDCYFVNLGMTAVKSKIVPIGVIDSKSGQIISISEPFENKHLDTAVELVSDLQEFCNFNNFTYDIELGGPNARF